MLDLYYAPTPNGWKATVMLAECGLDYQLITVDLHKGQQREDRFLALNPNGRIPVLVDDAPVQGKSPRVIFESGAILVYLAEKCGALLPDLPHERDAALQWLMWQMSAFGPILGQNAHFKLYAADRLDYAIERFGRETARLYGVLDRRLSQTGRYLAGDSYSIADIACFCWAITHKAQGIDLGQYPSAARWFAEIRQRPGVIAGTGIGRMRNVQDMPVDQRRELLKPIARETE